MSNNSTNSGKGANSPKPLPPKLGTGGMGKMAGAIPFPSGSRKNPNVITTTAKEKGPRK